MVDALTEQLPDLVSRKRGRRPGPKLPQINPADVERYRTRRKAVEWFREQGVETVSFTMLERLAGQGRGPRYSYLGKTVYYTEADLALWLRMNLRNAR